MNLNTEKIDEAVLALLYLGLHDESRTWKSFDWNSMDRLYKKGFITNPVGKARSVMFTEDCIKQSERLFKEVFTWPGQ